MRYRAQFDWPNFFLADLSGGLRPLRRGFPADRGALGSGDAWRGAHREWVTGIALHAPVAALIDVTRFKLGLLVGGVAALPACALAIAWGPTLQFVLAAASSWRCWVRAGYSRHHPLASSGEPASPNTWAANATCDRARVQKAAALKVPRFKAA